MSLSNEHAIKCNNNEETNVTDFSVKIIKTDGCTSTLYSPKASFARDSLTTYSLKAI
jgi:hypothetical protein